jgi:hypothetical protein
MPEAIDLNVIREQAARIEELQHQNLSDAEIQRQLEQEQIAQRRQLQQARGALNADALPPGSEPQGDPIDDAIRAGHFAGRRGSDAAMRAYVDKLFAAAQRGDARVMSQGIVTSETREAWMADAHQRQVANREASGWTNR